MNPFASRVGPAMSPPHPCESIFVPARFHNVLYGTAVGRVGSIRMLCNSYGSVWVPWGPVWATFASGRVPYGAAKITCGFVWGPYGSVCGPNAFVWVSFGSIWVPHGSLWMPS